MIYANDMEAEWYADADDSLEKRFAEPELGGRSEIYAIERLRRMLPAE